MKTRKSDQEYFKRLLERIKLIRTSERMFYQKITDIFAECSIDYDKNGDIAKDFYAIVLTMLLPKIPLQKSFITELTVKK